MRYFIGLDVSHRTTSISIIDERGERVRDETVATEVSAIVTSIKPYRRTCVRVGIESCAVAVWLAPELAKHRLPVVCIEARHAHQVLKTNLNKTDRNDARGIAQLMRTGMFRVVHLKSPETRNIQTLLTVRRIVQAKAHDIENAIGGIMRSFGMKVPRVHLKSFEAKIRTELASNAELARIIEPLLTLRAALQREFDRLDAEVRAIAKADPVCRRLMTAPGVGPFVALTYRAVIDVPERFRRSQTVGAHLGLTPRTIQTGQTEYRTRISRCGDMEARRALYLAAWGVFKTRNSPNPLRDWGQSIAQRSGKGKALIAVARRLAVILHRMWLDGTDYRVLPTLA